ncbi:acyltransferase family protein [Arthrobacter sp. Z4-13]
MDFARGLAIILIIVFHSVVEVDIRVEVPSWALIVNEILSPMRLPVLVFLSGMLLTNSLRKSPVNYLAGKSSRILWPYLLWSGFMMALFAATAPFTHESTFWQDPSGIVLHPIDHLWFLRDLFVFYALALAARNAPRGVWIFGGLAACVCADFAHWEQVSRGAYLFVFFALGSSVSEYRTRAAAAISNPVVIGTSVLVAGLIIPAALMPGDVRYEPALLPVVAALGLLLVKVCRTVGLASGMKWLRIIGRDSLSYYLVHWPAILIVTRALPESLFLGNPFLLLCLTVTASLLCGFIVSEASKRIPCMRYLVSIPPLDAWRVAEVNRR